MFRYFIAGFAIWFALLIGGCAATPQENMAMSKDNAVADYIQVAGLEEIDSIQSFEQLYHKVISRKYIVIYDRKNSYLAAYHSPCKGLVNNTIPVDIRYDRRVLRARFDTYQGCRIAALYGVTKGQEQELLDIGKEPGEEP